MTEIFLVQNLEVQRGSAIYSLTDGSLSTLLDHDGVGLPDTNPIVERGPLQHGASFLDFRLGPRSISYTLGVPGTSAEDLQERLATISRLFKPGATPIFLTYTLPDGSKRRIECRHGSGPTYGYRDVVRHYQRIAIRVTAYDSYFYDPTLSPIIFGVGGAGAGFPVPTPVPFTVGAAYLDATKTVVYSGTWRAYPNIQISGPISNPVIQNLSTDEILDFTGISLLANEKIYIDLTPGVKTVVDHNGVNRINWLTDASDLSTFHLGEDDDIPEGANDILATGTGINTLTEIYISYHTKYISLY